MLADALQHVHQVSVGVNIVQLAGADQALDDAQVFRAQFGPTGCLRDHCAVVNGQLRS